MSEDDFISIKFDREWPMIIQNLSKYLTGQELKSNKINESDEFKTHANIDELFKDPELNFYRVKLAPVPPEKIDFYTYALNSFRVFEGKDKKALDSKDIE